MDCLLYVTDPFFLWMEWLLNRWMSLSYPIWKKVLGSNPGFNIPLQGLIIFRMCVSVGTTNNRKICKYKNGTCVVHIHQILVNLDNLNIVCIRCICQLQPDINIQLLFNVIVQVNSFPSMYGLISLSVIFIL